MLLLCKSNMYFGLSSMQNSLDKCERCLQLHGDYERASEVVRQWIMSAHKQFAIAQQLNQSHEDLLRKQQLLKVDAGYLLVYLCLAFAVVRSSPEMT